MQVNNVPAPVPEKEQFAFPARQKRKTVACNFRRVPSHNRRPVPQPSREFLATWTALLCTGLQQRLLSKPSHKITGMLKYETRRVASLKLLTRGGASF